MSKLFCKHLHLCFFKLKYPTIPQSPPQPHHHTQSPSSSNTHNHKDSDFFIYSSSDTCWDLQPDFASVLSSQRFFFSSPGPSNSIIDTRPCNSNSHINSNNNNNTKTSILKGGVRVTKYSVDPYVDFRRSMQEMIDSRELVDVRKHWDYLHDLLLCYLALNPPHTHNYILRAFTDLVVHLLSSSSLSPLQPPSSVVKTCHCGRVVSQGGWYN